MLFSFHNLSQDIYILPTLLSMTSWVLDYTNLFDSICYISTTFTLYNVNMVSSHGATHKQKHQTTIHQLWGHRRCVLYLMETYK